MFNEILLYQGDIVGDGGQGGVDVLDECVGLTTFCWSTIPRRWFSLPVIVLHLLDLIVNQHDEGADDHEKGEGDDEDDGRGEFKNLLHPPPEE